MPSGGWNKGLTKEIDVRVARIAVAISATLIVKYPKPILEIKLCECGCGEYAKPGNRFINGHNFPEKKHSEDTKKKISKSRLGKKHSEDTKIKMRKPKSEEHKKNMSKGKIGKKHSEEQKKNKKEIMNRPDVKAKCRAAKLGKCLGKDNGNWQGGITPLYQILRVSFKSIQWIKSIFIRDNYTCQECDQVGGDLEAHHIKSFQVILLENKFINLEDYENAINCEELWAINNGVTLCKECHKKEMALTMEQVKIVRKEEKGN